MNLERSLFDLDFLVYSSHKSASQTTVLSLVGSGFRCGHCHLLRDLGEGLLPQDFPGFLERFVARNGRKLGIVTVFREPIERHISSFFQWYGDGVVREKVVADRAETIISTWSVTDLQAMFIDELNRQEVPGMPESIDEMRQALGLDVTDLRFCTTEHHGVVDLPGCRIFLFRFDSLLHENRLESLFTKITNTPIKRQDSNVTATKWYGEKFAAFKATLRIPRDTLIAAYAAKRHLIDLFYPGEYESLLAQRLAKYGSTDRS